MENCPLVSNVFLPWSLGWSWVKLWVHYTLFHQLANVFEVVESKLVGFPPPINYEGPSVTMVNVMLPVSKDS